jgi:hypothetical protein
MFVIIKQVFIKRINNISAFDYLQQNCVIFIEIVI